MPATCFADAGDYGTASQLFTDFIRNYPHHRNLPEARLLLARSYARSDRCEQAVPAYEQYLTEHPDHLGTAEARRERAVCWEQLGEFARAGQAHEEVQRLFPTGEFAVPALLDAAANYAKAGNLPAAVAAYEHLIAEYAGHRLASRARFYMARIAFASGQAERAQRLLDKVTSSGRDADAVKDAFLLTGRIRLFLGKPALAEQTFRALRNRYPPFRPRGQLLARPGGLRHLQSPVRPRAGILRSGPQAGFRSGFAAAGGARGG